MTAWTSDEINTIGAAHEVELATLRPDGTLRKPVTVWVVRVDDDLYLRSWRGPTAAWFRAAQDRGEGHIQAGGVDKDVVFIPAEDDINDQIDAAYRTKYRHSATFVKPMVSSEARATTIRLATRG